MRLRLRQNWQVRIIVGMAAPAPVGALIASVAQVDPLGLQVKELPVFYAMMTLFGYSAMGVQAVAYSLLMEFAGSYLPIIRRSIVLLVCSSAVISAFCVAAPFHLLGDGDPNGLFLHLAGATGAIVGLLLYPLARDKAHPKQTEPNLDIPATEEELGN